jgi:CpXC protein
MSLFDRLQARCPICGTDQQIALVGSVNAGRRADLRQQIIDRRFQEHVCSACGAAFRLPPGFTYADYGRNMWILAHPYDQLADWPAREAEALAAFAALYGPDAPAEAREIGAQIRPRVVFGWPAMREKVVAQDAGLDDVELELTKMAVLRNVPGSPIADEVELRFDRIEDAALILHWIMAPTESVVKTLRVPRSVYDDVAADAEAWAPLRAEFAGRCFVDVNRLLVAEAKA